MHLLSSEFKHVDEPVILDGLDITRELIQEFREGAHLQEVAARKRQLAIARKNQQMEVRRDDEWQMQAAVDPYFYHLLARQAGGYEVWEDDKELDKLLRDTPELRVNVEKRAVGVGWQPGEIVLTDKRGNLRCA